MKAVLTFLFTIVLFSCTAVQNESPVTDIVDVNRLTIRETSTGNSVPLLASPQGLTNVFGAPGSSVQEYSEVDDAMVTKWTYSGLTMYVESGNLDHFRFSTAAFGLVYNDQVIKVGQEVSSLNGLFPGSYATKTDDMVRVDLQVNGIVTDSFIVVIFDQHGIITDIFIGGE